MQGFTADAMVDFTGGVPEKLILKEMSLGDPEKREAFFIDLQAAVDNRALINCAIQVANKYLL